MSVFSKESSGSILHDFRAKVKKGLPITLDTISAVVDVVRNTESIDDRKLLLEHALTFVARLEDSSFSRGIQEKIVQLLYNDLAHPPATVLGNKYAWRTADGSNNNPDLPDMGKAGTPYARSVQQSHPLPQNQLPDPGLIFDTLLKRDGFVKHPAGLSSLMFSFAALVIHSVFRTSHHDVNINETSSYVDLSPLYGHNQAAQDRVRVRDGRGLLHPDVFAEDRLLLLPPATCVILVLFSRNHNYIARKLLEINERGNFVDPATLSPDVPTQNVKLIAQEEELFQVARLINCGWFGSVVFSDYFSCILGLVRDGSSWSLNPFEEFRLDDHSVFERGKGNACSVEFNCLYRWHATTSVEDEKWVGTTIDKLFDGKNPDEITTDDFKGVARKILQSQPDITHWTFGSLQRQPDGTFRNEDLARVLHNATENPAAAFRARGTPAVMRLHEVMGIEQNRKWGVCSLNDFRKYLGLKPYSSFKEWNPDPEIADAAEKLYGHIDYLELYVGLQAEEAKPVVDGAGLCPGYTISRAILSDAIALTRGDRHFTYDYTPFNLTSWGFADCQRDPDAFGFGSTLGRLFLRTLPDQFTENSIYTFFPLMTPDSMTTHLTDMKVIGQYDVSRPKPQSPLQVVQDHSTIGDILKNEGTFVAPYAARATRVIKGKGFYTAEAEKERREVVSALTSTPNFVDKTGQFFYQTTRTLIDDNSFTVVGGKRRGLDLVRNVLRTVPIYWAATEVAGIPLKTKEHPQGAYTPNELYDILADIYTFVFLDVEASKVRVLQGRVEANLPELLRHIVTGLNGTAGQKFSIGNVLTSFFAKPKKTEHLDFIRQLSDLGYTSDHLANTVLAILVSSVELSLSLTNTVNLYLGSEKDADVRALAKSSDLKTTLDGYVREALRIDPPFQGVYRVVSNVQSIAALSLKKDDIVFLDIAAANVDERVIPDAKAINITRNPKQVLQGDGTFRSLGESLTIKIVSEVLRAVFSYDNIRRSSGQSGSLQRFKDNTRPQLRFAYLDRKSATSAWPTALAVQYDTK